MKSKINKKFIQIGIVAFLVIVFSILFFFLCFQLKSFTDSVNRLIVILKPIIYGCIIAYLLTPLTNFIERKIIFPIYLKKHDSIPYKRKRIYRIISMLLTIAVILGLISVLMSSVVPQVGNSIKIISVQLPNYIDALSKWGNSILLNNASIIQVAENLIDIHAEDITQYFSDTILPSFQNMAMNFSTSIISLLKNVWNLVIGIIVSIYVLLNKETFSAQAKKITYALLKRETANLIIKDTRFVSDTFIGFLGGKIVDSIIVFIICFIGSAALNLPYPILISVIVGLTNIIPFFGPFIGAIPSALLILMVDPLKCLYFIIFVLILQQLDGNVIGPLILGDSTGLSGFWVIFSITVFGGLWGVFGMIIGIPLFAVVYALIKRYIERKLKAKELPTNTNSYRPIKSIDEDGIIIELFEANDINFRREQKNVKEKTDEFLELLKHKKTHDSDIENNDDSENENINTEN